ncbi:ABC transporter ATP-binding protein [Candidatus Enterococcus mansonii]|uniref:ABC transporter domain-containing protein n=1 Tax=Candidatus Enterococcus mansonii TaxID=1834181 RepID=A0A242CIZ3_9ENTE|nr:ABC transporter ATP-binding protein [Enterococcus sp. 4G2_DIV0659]OTO10205.1 hypothetical protein A5880_000888 [Enterococcus sp. 4G2_DIV0659]
MGYLEIKNLSFQYAGTDKPVLNNVSFSVEQGAFILLCGASGSGKSTLLKLLKPQLTPSGQQTGDIYLENETIMALPEPFSSSNIGYVMQKPENQMVTENVWHELAFGLENLGVSTSEIKSRIAEMVHFLGIQELLDYKTSELSGGQKQLLNLASVLVMKPEILLLDEPTTQLDPIASQKFIDLLVRLNREMGVTILLAEHHLESVFASADKVLILEKGELLFAGKPKMISKLINTNRQELSRFSVSLPSAVQIYLGSGIMDDCPLTVVEGKRFLARHFPIVADFREEKTASISRQIGIELKNCWFRYEKQGPDIVAGVDFQVYEGEIFTLVGGNGTGKTTLLKVIAGIKKCYRGKVSILNQPIKKAQDTVGYLPQEPEMLFIKDSIIEEYTDHLERINVNKTEQTKRINDITNLLDLNDVLTKHPLDLSGGEIQRAALGKVLLADAKVLLLDEPTKGIDNYAKKQLIYLLKKLSKQGKTILLVTHDLDFAAELSDRCGLFFQNNVLSVAAPKQFFSQHAFYTTAASRISRVSFHDLVTTDQVITACNSKKGAIHE